MRLAPRLTSRRSRTLLAAAAMLLAVLTVAEGLGAAPAAMPLQSTSMPLDRLGGGGQVADFGARPPSLPSGSISVSTVAPPGVPAGTTGLAPTVDTVQPALRVRGVDPAAVGAVSALEGVATAVALRTGVLTVQAAAGPQQITVAAVDPVAFRPLTPDISAAEVAVWDRIVAGDAALTHDVGHGLGVPLGATVAAGPAATGLRIGAYASNGIPPVADAIVSTEAGHRLGLQGGTDLLIAVPDGVDPDAVGAAVVEVAGGTAERIEPPPQQQALLTGSSARDFFEPFSYIDHGDGMISIDRGWVSRNIVSARVPIFTGEVVCHRQMVVQLRGALQEVVNSGLAHLIDPSQYGGCWVPRHIDWRPDRPLSMHAWGLAVDINVSTNQLGQPPQMDPRIVEIFDRWGFVWGGRWRRPDGMHFEIGAVLR